jgi:hypothetical protein
MGGIGRGGIAGCPFYAVELFAIRPPKERDERQRKRECYAYSIKPAAAIDEVDAKAPGHAATCQIE